MTAPHEEEWKTGEGALSGALYSGETWIGSFIDPKRARLAVQAPALVRALLAELASDGHTMGCNAAHGQPECSPRCARFRAALKAAGVIP